MLVQTCALTSSSTPGLSGSCPPGSGYMCHGCKGKRAKWPYIVHQGRVGREAEEGGKALHPRAHVVLKVGRQVLPASRMRCLLGSGQEPLPLPGS